MTNSTPSFPTDKVLEDERFFFSRKTIGGMIIDTDGLIGKDLHLSESLVRNFGLQHGDKVKVSKKQGFIDQRSLSHNIELVEKRSDGEPAPTKEFKNGIVEIGIENKYFVEKNALGNYISEEIGKRFDIPEYEVRKRDLVSGDIVDIAYSKDNFADIRVR